MTEQNKAITGVEMGPDDYTDYILAVAALRRIMDRRFDDVWTFKDKKNPVIEWDGVTFLVKG